MTPRTLTDFLQDESLGLPAVPSPQEKPKVSPFEEWFSGAPETRSNPAVGSLAVQEGAKRQADISARVLDLAGKTGLPQDLIGRNLEAVEAEYKKQTFNNAMLHASPELAKWVSESPEAAGTILGGKTAVRDLQAFGQLERYLTLPSSQWPRTDERLMEIAKRRSLANLEARVAGAPAEIQMYPASEYVAEHARDSLATLQKIKGGDKKLLEQIASSEYWRLKEREAYIGQQGAEGLPEFAARKLRNYHELMPFGGSLPESSQTIAVMESALAVKEQRATQADVDLLEDYGRMAEAQERRGQKWYTRAAEIVTQSVPFAAELGLTGGLYSGVKEGVSAGLMRLLARGGAEAAQSLLRRSVAAVLSRGAGLVAQTAVAAGPKIVAGATQNLLKGDSALKAWADSTANQLIEVGTERLSGPMGRAYGAVLEKFGAAEAKGLIRKAVDYAVAGSKKLEAVGIGGVGTEYLEERAADFLHTVIRGEKYPGVFGADPLAEIAGFGALPLAAAPLQVFAKPRLPSMPQVEMNAEAMREIAATLKDSNLLKNAPAEAEKLVERMTKGADVSVPIADFVEFHQKQGIDPRAKAESLGIADQYDEALKTGADVVIPRAKAVTRIAAVEGGEGFADIVSWTPGEASKNEAKQILNTVGQPGEAPVDPIAESQAKLADTLTSTLVESGKFKENQARPYAEQIAAFYRTQGLRIPTKQTAEELFKAFPVGFERAGFTGEGFQQPSTTAEVRQGSYIPATEADAAKIKLHKEANLSTTIHEMGHHYLEVFSAIASLDGSDKQVKEDMKATLDWLGVKDLETWRKMSLEEKRPSHEKWARANEKYWMEGKAPSSALRRVFSKFASWMTWLYKKASNLNVDIPPHIREVMDRLWATQEEIDATRTEMEAPKNIWEQPEKFGLTENQSNQLLGAIADSRAAFAEQLRAKFMEEIKREDDAKWQELFEKVKKDVREDVNKEQAQVAYYALHDGTQPDGSPLPAGINPLKLARADVRNHFGGQEVVNSIPDGILVDHAKGTIYPDAAAEQYGYTSGKALINALVNMEMREHKVDRLARERMKDFYPSFFEDQEARADEAVVAYHNGHQAVALRKALELLLSDDFAKAKGLIRKLNRRIPSDEEIKQDAEEAVLKQKVRSVYPDVYKKAEARAARETTERWLKGDWEGAFDALLKQLVNFERFKAASDYKDKIKGAVAFTRKFDKESVQGRLGKAGYLEQIQKLLSRFGLGSMSKADRATRKTLEAFIKERVAEGDTYGEEVYADARILNEDIEESYQNLSVGEFMGMIDAVRQLDHTAKMLDEFRTQEERIAFTEAKNEFVAAGRSNIPQKPPPPLSRLGEGMKDKAKRALRTGDAALVKTEELANEWDKNNIKGPFHRLIFNPMDDAQSAEIDLQKKVGAEVAKKVLRMPKEVMKHLRDYVEVPGAPFPVTHGDAIGMFLNKGTRSSESKMVRGEMGRIHDGRVIGLTGEQIQHAINQLSKAETDFAQSLLDLTDVLRIPAFEHQKRLTGIEPEKLEPQKIVTPNGVYDGGYFPQFYNPDFGSRKVVLDLASSVGDLFESGYIRATTPQGHLKSRVEAYAAPILYDAWRTRLPGHISGVIKDITHREAIINVNKLLADPDVKDAINSRLGSEYYKRLNEWLRQIANDRNNNELGTLRPTMRLYEKLRLNYAMSKMMFKAAVGFSQFAGIANSIETVGPTNFLKGMAHFLRHPRNAYKEMVAESGEMRHRTKTLERDLGLQLRRLEGQPGILPRIQEAGMYPIAFADMLVSIPTYFGGKYQQLDKDPADLKAAIRAGGAAVRLSQGAGAAKDMAAIVASRGIGFRAITMFYGWASALYSRFRNIEKSVARGDLKGGKKQIAWLTARIALLWPIAGTLAAVANGKGPDDDEGWFHWWVKNNILYPLNALPVFRDTIGFLTQGWDYQTTPLERGIKDVLDVPQEAKKVFTGKDSVEKLVHEAFDATGTLFGIPTSQLDISGEYLKDIFEGDVTPGSIEEFLHDMFYRRPRERNRD